MTDLSRRHFLRTATVGAAAAGALAASGTALFSATDAVASPSAVRAAEGSDVPAGRGSDIFAHVADLATGKVTVFHGTEAYTITDPGLAQALARVMK